MSKRKKYIKQLKKQKNNENHSNNRKKIGKFSIITLKLNEKLQAENERRTVK